MIAWHCSVCTSSVHRETGVVWVWYVWWRVFGVRIEVVVVWCCGLQDAGEGDEANVV